MRSLCLFLCVAALPTTVRAEDAVFRPLPISPAPEVAINPFAQCDAAIGAAAKRRGRLPVTLLPAIARIESGRLDAATGRVRPWPWTINVDGVGYFFDTKPQVVAAVQALQAKGKRSIDVGCMQVNLMHHPTAFPDLDQAFDPVANANYAVTFLVTLYQLTRNWPLATAYYHSSTPDLGEEYQRLVFGKVLAPMGATGAKPIATTIWPLASERYAAIPPLGFNFAAFAPQRPPKLTTTFGTPTVAIGSFPNLLQGTSKR